MAESPVLPSDMTLEGAARNVQRFVEENQQSQQLLQQQQRKAHLQEELCFKIRVSLDHLRAQLDSEPQNEVIDIAPIEAAARSNDQIIAFDPDLIAKTAKFKAEEASSMPPDLGLEFASEASSHISVSWELPTLTGTRSGKAGALRQHSERMREYGLAQWTLNHLARAMETLEMVREPIRRGCFASFVQSVYFSLLSLTVILLNTIYITIWADYELSTPGTEVHPDQAVEWAFSAFYCLELAAKLSVHRFYFFLNEDWSWNTFDLILVLLVLVENLVSAVSATDPTGAVNIMFIRVLRLFKLARVFRIMRTFRFFTELRLMTECVVGSLMNAIWCIALLFIVKYIFALLIAQALVGHWFEEGGTDSAGAAQIMRFYPSVGGIMVTLLQSTTGGVDWRDAFDALAPTGVVLQAVFIIFILVFTVSIWNIVTSVFVEKALKLAEPDLDAIVVEQLSKEKVMFNSLVDFFFGPREEQDVDELGEITPEVFRNKVDDPKFRCYLSAHGIDIKNVKTFFTMMSTNDSEEPQGVDIKRLAHACVRMKGFATSLDLQSLGYETKLMHQKQMQVLKRMKEQLKHNEVAIQKMLYNTRTEAV